ncbi:hypothetical protein RHAB21_00776 [Pseudorhizobium halotolerans]|jgi:hypothetical protein|uniref:Uncharacterized protein n=1 Tax=Pseudorhizobium halotolerans TaxID=1233081 RepID=A0ABM8PZ35_9HYPH|nr:hypothetical protein [Pseudorhizobium halotolerans]CAD7055708.1 hypothetical protein RHAB21_00776 [Pseudorhizobium halotolerans]
MEENRVELIAQSNLFNVRIVENGLSTERQFRVRAFATSWAEGQSLRLGVHVVQEISPATEPRTSAPSDRHSQL